MEWEKLETQADIDKLMQLINNFHDSCIKGLTYSSGTYVDGEYSMIMNTEPVVNLWIQRQSEFMTNIELCLRGVSKFHINNDLNLTLDILGVHFTKQEDDFYWYSSEDIEDETVTSFVCKEIKWRSKSSY
ncbi:hypothetical protein QJV38_11040 [Listeria cossartiae subsp. cayugensis]|uniref:DUF600 family protein n=1 Tax=Listeria cossartiae subsp. cayugensis TaxID=2713505 RepID=A0ABU2IQY2_9LIST|nr:hypothetical protein [Listeria cossartiae]MDT0050284.1 hypothetical protein [Listeria cossartiae subsp. cayugensis]MDT0066670.1 hypothetical protein [Listeria cossartiae subsp. cayugensis]MDT0080675.1 hypothetical protein [Listeria cossartiae subsp. cayugensis]MDT0082889.1 hypothetical protein [Listeria cossartiae subsp. cayugensis]MDT0089019.1 hypothetical protein [Listeria cossartiae subsp. cayugensis]